LGYIGAVFSQAGCISCHSKALTVMAYRFVMCWSVFVWSGRGDRSAVNGWLWDWSFLPWKHYSSRCALLHWRSNRRWRRWGWGMYWFLL